MGYSVIVVDHIAVGYKKIEYAMALVESLDADILLRYHSCRMTLSAVDS